MYLKYFYCCILTTVCIITYSVPNILYLLYLNLIHRCVREGSVHRGRQMVPGNERGGRVAPQDLVRAAADHMAAAGREKGV